MAAYCFPTLSQRLGRESVLIFLQLNQEAIKFLQLSFQSCKSIFKAPAQKMETSSPHKIQKLLQAREKLKRKARDITEVCLLHNVIMPLPYNIFWLAVTYKAFPYQINDYLQMRVQCFSSNENIYAHWSSLFIIRPEQIRENLWSTN